MLAYAIPRNIKEFHINAGITHQSRFPLCLFNSSCLNKLSLNMPLTLNNSFRHSWTLPALTYLQLKCCDLPEFSWSLPSLTDLYLCQIKFSKDKTVCFSEFVSLKSLALDDCRMSLDLEVFDNSSAQLEKLYISNWLQYDPVDNQTCKFVVSTPKLSSFYFKGYAPILLSADGLDCLDKVHIDYIDYGTTFYKYFGGLRPKIDPKIIGQQLINMFKELGGAKCLTLISSTIEVLSMISDLLENQLSPFSNLKWLKLKELEKSTTSTIPSHVRTYLLSKSPGAIVIQESPKMKVVQKAVALPSDVKPLSKTPTDDALQVGNCVSANANNDVDGTVAGQESSGSNCMNLLLTEETNVRGCSGLGNAGEVVEHIEEVHDDAVGQVGAQGEHVEVGGNEDILVKDTSRERVEEEEEHVNNVLSNVQAIGVVPRALVSGGEDQVGSSRKKDDFKLWHGRAVSPEFVDLLELIKKKYPETFELFSPQSEMIYTVDLNTLCTAVNSFSDVSMIEVTAGTITQFKGIFADLERWGFNVDWLVNHLNCIEQLRFSRPLVDELCMIDCRLEDAQRQVRELQGLRVAKMAEIEEAFRHLGTSLAAGRLGDGLFPDH